MEVLVQNNSAFTIEIVKCLKIELVIAVDSWSKTLHKYDHTFRHGAIMPGQSAWEVAKENKFDIFTIDFLSINVILNCS